MFILTEKPSVAQSFADALGGFDKKDGYFTNGKDCIVSAHGHLLQLYNPEDYDEKYSGEWKKSFNELPIIPETYKYKQIPDPTHTLNKIKKCFQTFDSSEFILATDAEREGELIGALILSYVGFKDYQHAKRFWVSEALTPEVVKKGLANAKPLLDYESYKEAGYARAKADWLIGMNFTRYITVSADKLFSFGRCQTAILGAIYLREMNIKNFKPIPYQQLSVTVSKNNINFNMLLQTRTKQEYSDRFDPTDLFHHVAKDSLSPGSNLKVVNVNKDKKSENPPQLFNITGLQKYCSTNYKLTPTETLNIAQKLYEEYKCLSYPRTPSVVLGDDNVELFREKYELLKNIYSKSSSGCDVTLIDSNNKRIFNSSKLQDHHALIPLSPLPDKANNDERNVYAAVLNRFFQVIKKEYIYNQITVEAEYNNYHYIAKGTNIIQKGWKDNNIEQENNDDDETKLPDLEINDLLKVIKTTILDKQTQPKKHFTNATILSLMENPRDDSNSDKLVGIGTPATRASIIQTLIDRKYIVQDKQNLLITESGIFLIEIILKIPSLANFISLKTTTDWEQKLQNNPNEFLKNITEFVKEEIPQIQIENKWKGDSLGTCPLCNVGLVKEGKQSYFCSQWKEGCKFSIWKEYCGSKINNNDLKNLLDNKTTSVKKFKSKNGKTFNAALKLKLENGISKLDFIFQNKK